MRYFVVSGYLPTPHPPQRDEMGYSHTFLPTDELTRDEMAQRYREADIPLPTLGDNTYLRASNHGRLSVFVFGSYDALILISAKSQRSAYLIGNAFRATLTCFWGDPPMDTQYAYLLELSKKPMPGISRREMADAILEGGADRGYSPLQIESTLKTGVVLNHTCLTDACSFVLQVITNPTLLDALLHLEQSRRLVWGFMVGSFYDSHYSRERDNLSRYELERRYLEERFRYDSAFVAAFRGIECVLNTPHFKKTKIQDILGTVDREHGSSFSSKKYRSWHEVFSSRKKWWPYAKLIEHYLKLRNAVSAHGNPSPHHIVMEDQVFEIQYLLQSMLSELISQRKSP